MLESRIKPYSSTMSIKPYLCVERIFSNLSVRFGSILTSASPCCIMLGEAKADASEAIGLSPGLKAAIFHFFSPPEIKPAFNSGIIRQSTKEDFPTPLVP